MSKPPAPGSDAAIEAGCTCPVTDNGHGDGRPSPDGGEEFVYVLGCPVHAPATAAEGGGES